MAQGTMTTGETQAVTASSQPRSASAVRGWLVGLWGARGWWGGIAAIALAAQGQQILVTTSDQAQSLRYYLAAIVLLIAVLLHPRLPSLRRTAPAPPAKDPVAADSTLAVSAAPPARTNLPVRRAVVATDSLPSDPADVASPTAPISAPTPALARRERFNIGLLRARLGWRATAGGLGLAALFAAGAAKVLLDDITAPLGGWLWAAALATLLLTFVGAEGWPRGGGLLPGPKGDFFSKGLPQFTPRQEAILVGGVLLLALALRLVNLEYMPGIFGDEGERGMDARAINEGRPALIFGYGWWGVPNLYFYLVSWMLRIFGDTMVGDRMLSVISGVAAVWFVYRIGRLLWGPRAGLIAGALLAVSPLALQFSRLAGESTPTGALWAGGFYFFFLALRHRRPLDWLLAGTLWGFSLYFYAAGKLIIPLIAGVGLYCLVRWQIEFFRRYFLGFVLIGLAFGLTFMPYALFSVKDNWQGFTGRAQETSIFSPQNQPQAFAKYGIPYTPPPPGQSLPLQVLSNPLPWAQVVLQQMRATTEVIYYTGDPTPFYQLSDHRGSMLAPLWAALALLGLAYAGWKFWDGRFALLSLWFWGGMLGAALTMDTPSVQRLTGAWPVLMLFPAALIDRICAAGWPLSLSLARRWSTLPVAALLVFFTGDSYKEYFNVYGATCTYCTATTQARYAQALGQEYRGYQLGVGGYDVFFSYGSTRFVAKGVEGDDLAVPVDYLPITNNKGRGAAFIVYAANADYLPLIRLMYPGGLEEVIKGTDGSPVFTSYKLTGAQMAAFQTVHAQYTPATGSAINRDEPALGMLRAPDAPGGPWSAPPGLTYPALATWQGGLVAPGYGLYTLDVTGATDAKLTLDGQVIFDATAARAAKDGRVTLVLAKGLHSVQLSGTLVAASTHLNVQWAGVGQGFTPIAAKYLYNGPSGGLSAEVWAGSLGASTAVDAPAPDAKQPVTSRRSDPALGFREATVTFGNGAFYVRWQGTLQAATAGTYGFETSSNGPSLVRIDDKVVVTGAGGMAGASGTIDLSAGPHTVDVRYAWQGGPARMEWFWTPPGGQRALVPPSVLSPLARSWPQGAVPDPGTAPPDLRPPAAPPQALQPAAILGGDAGLEEPRGVGVDKSGQVFIGDTAHHRVVRLGADGKKLGEWGGATITSAPGLFNQLADLAVGPDGHVVTLDAGNGDVQIFAADGTLLQHRPGATSNASGLAVGPDGHIWIANTGGSNLLRLQPDGTPDAAFTGGDAGTRLRFEQPVDVAVAADGTVYLVDLRARVLRVDAAGNTQTEWAVEIGTTRGGSHLTVWGDQVIVSNPDTGRLALLDPASGDVRYAGGAGTGSGQFRLPIGLAAGGPEDRLYVVDSENGRVQVFSTLEMK